MPHAVVGCLAALPTVFRQKTRDAADCIARATTQVDATIAIEVNREAANTAGHELRQANRAGKRTAHTQLIEIVLTCKQQKIFQLAAKKFSPSGVVKGQHRECIDDSEIAGNAAINRLNTDDRDDDFLRYSVLL